MVTLKRILFTLALALLAPLAGAAPFLTAIPVPSSPIGPSSVAFRVDADAWATAGCTWATSGSTKTFFCDLAGTNTTPGTRQYEAKYIYVGGCDVNVTPEVCVPAGEAVVTTPLSVVWVAPGAPATLRVVSSAAP